MTDTTITTIGLVAVAVIGAVGNILVARIARRGVQAASQAVALGTENKAKLDDVKTSVDGQSTRTDKHIVALTELVSTGITGQREVKKARIKKTQHISRQ